MSVCRWPRSVTRPSGVAESLLAVRAERAGRARTTRPYECSPKGYCNLYMDLSVSPLTRRSTSPQRGGRMGGAGGICGYAHARDPSSLRSSG